MGVVRNGWPYYYRCEESGFQRNERQKGLRERESDGESVVMKPQ